MKERKVATRTQQIIIDSRYKKSGSDNDYVINLRGVGGQSGTATQNLYSNVFFSSFDQVVGIKVLGVFIKDTQTVASAVTGATAIDFVCPQIPQMAQQLQAQHGYVWCRVPLTRNYIIGATDPILQDQWWEAPSSKTQFFSPRQLSELNISLWTNEATPASYGNGTEHPNYLIVEITSLDRPLDILP